MVDDGVGLEVRTAGSGPAFVLVHGLGGAKEDFDDHVGALATHCTVVTFDLRGHGDSDRPEDPASYSLDRLAADTLAVADALGFGSFRLLGHSMGGMAARRVVFAVPARVEALVLMDTSPGPPTGMDLEIVALGVKIARDQGVEELKRVMEAFDPLGTPAYRETLATRPGYREYTDWKWSRLSNAMYVALLHEVNHQPDQLAELAALRMPVLVIVGEQDQTFIDASRAMAAAIDGARLVVVADAGHSPQFENPKAWRSAIEAFLDEHRVAA